MSFEENWVEIEEFPNYAVSDCGRVMNVRTGRILKGGINSRGYRTAVFVNNYCRKSLTLHSLVAAAFVDGWFEGAEVNHIDGVKTNNWLENLEWCTRSENHLHAYAMGLREPSRMYKQIRCLETGDVFSSVNAAAEHFGVYPQGITNVVHGRSKSARGYTFELV